MSQKYRNRIVEVLQDYAVDDCQPCPWNWRGHPDAQREALRNALNRLGIITGLLARRRADGQLELLDGHLRKDELRGHKMTILVTDLVDEAEAKEAILCIDPIAMMAQTQQDKLQGLREQMKAQSPELRKKLESMAGLRTKETEAVVKQQWYAVIECDKEATQKAVLAELLRHDLQVKAVSVGYTQAPKQEAPEVEPMAVKGKVIVRETVIQRTPRVLQLEGQFDLKREKKTRQTWKVDLTLDQPWQVGLIVGPSGSGKSTIARELFGDKVVEKWDWPADQSIVDAFPESMEIQEITELLSSVGFSSPPSWRKPYQVLSNGERFRVDLARTLAESPELAVVDEFTSVVDRQVAKIGSAAVAKTVRASGRRFVAVTCHYDVEEWLTPDWVYDVVAGKLDWRSKRRRPAISLQFRRVGTDAWQRFAGHHYLTGKIHRAAKCVLVSIEQQPAAFVAFMHYPGKQPYFQIHRVVCLPDYQGVGIGSASLAYVAGCAAAIDGRAVRITTSHPGLMASLIRSPLWRMEKAPSLTLDSHHGVMKNQKGSMMRPTAAFRFIGVPQYDGAAALKLAE